jgi:hypothetical protein
MLPPPYSNDLKLARQCWSLAVCGVYHDVAREGVLPGLYKGPPLAIFRTICPSARARLSSCKSLSSLYYIPIPVTHPSIHSLTMAAPHGEAQVVTQPQAIETEKHSEKHNEFFDEEGKPQAAIDYSGAHEKTDPAEIALVRKLDRWIMPTLWSMYWLNYLVYLSQHLRRFLGRS